MRPFLYRKFSGNNFTNVNIFVSQNQSSPKEYLTIPIHNTSAMIASCNDFFTNDMLAKHPNCVKETLPYHMVKYIAGVLRLPTVTVLNTYCHTHDQVQVFEVHYIEPIAKSVEEVRHFLEIGEIIE